MTIKKTHLNEYQANQLKKVFSDISLGSIYRFQKPTNAHVALLYPINDLLLFEDQYVALLNTIRFLKEEKIYVIQTEKDSDLFCEATDVYEFDISSSFQEYQKLPIYSISLLFSNSMKWFLLTDETLEGGIGLLISDKDTIEQFKRIYGRCDQDICAFVAFSLKDADRNQHSIDNLSKIISCLYDRCHYGLYRRRHE